MVSGRHKKGLLSRAWRFIIVIVLLCMVLAFTGYRAIHGKGRLHSAAVNAYRRYRSLSSSYQSQALPEPPAGSTVDVDVEIDINAENHAISPYIYGMASAPPSYVRDLRLKINRWGGNSATRYNWVHGNATNAARDWKWANRVATTDATKPGPSSAADQFVLDNRSAGADTLLTIPTIGWVAVDSDNATTSLNVPEHGGVPTGNSSGSIANYDPKDNRKRTSQVSVASLKANPSVGRSNSGIVCQDEWVKHLVKRFGPAASRGVRFYAMDNEPDLWDYTHTDIHPARSGYDDILANFSEYSSAVKAVDPTALVTGPVVSGWTGYLYSALDRGDDNFHTHADCTNHRNEVFLLWFLKSLRTQDLASGRRSIDVLDVHYYPQGQGLYAGAADRDSQARRLRSTRALWDPTYTDESWINDRVRLIPRLKEWIAAGYPGTKIGITEWNFGADNDMSGAIAIADVLGIFGREDVYLANYWAYPPKNSPGYLAFKLFVNADGNGHGFGDMSCRTVTRNNDWVSSYAAIDSSSGDITVLFTNRLQKSGAKIRIASSRLGGFSEISSVWLLSDHNSSPAIIQDSAHIDRLTCTVTMPAYSVMLVRLKSKQRSSQLN